MCGPGATGGGRAPVQPYGPVRPAGASAVDRVLDVLGTLRTRSGGAEMDVRRAGGDGGSFGPDEALGHLEDILLGLPFDRAVPDLATLLTAAGVDEDVLQDERALKLLHEALVARPFGDLDGVQRVRTEVELLTLETELLTDRLAAASTPTDEVDRARRRLAEIRLRLGELRDLL
jgi:hypothetical protein